MAKDISVLLIDDEPDFLKLMGDRIESWSYELLTASSGKEGMDALVAKKPDIMVLDYLLPDADGISLLKQIRKINEKIPVIMLTAYPEPKAMEGAEGLNVVAFIPKLSAYGEAQSLLRSALHMAEKGIQ